MGNCFIVLIVISFLPLRFRNIKYHEKLCLTILNILKTNNLFYETTLAFQKMAEFRARILIALTPKEQLNYLIDKPIVFMLHYPSSLND